MWTVSFLCDHKYVCPLQHLWSHGMCILVSCHPVSAYLDLLKEKLHRRSRKICFRAWDLLAFWYVLTIFEYLVGHWRLQPIQCTIPSCKDFKKRHQTQVLLQERKPGIQTEDICSTMCFPPTIFASCYHSKYLVCYCKETNCLEFPPKQHRADVPIAVCQVVGIWPHKWPHHISAQPQPRRAQERLPGLETSKHFWCVFWQSPLLRLWNFQHMFNLAQVENEHANLCRMFIYPPALSISKTAIDPLLEASLFVSSSRASSRALWPSWQGCGCVGQHLKFPSTADLPRLL